MTKEIVPICDEDSIKDRLMKDIKAGIHKNVIEKVLQNRFV